jgi:predicted phage terminase large subunit-like protein
LFQQSPIVVGGGELPIEKLKVLPSFDRSMIVATVRYWDKAASTADKNGAFSAGALMHRCKDDTYAVEDVARGRWSASEREQQIRQVADRDRKTYRYMKIYIEQEPGSGGKESVDNTIRNLAGHTVYADKVTGSKQVRAQPFAAQVQAGNVSLLAGPWVQAFLDECEVWPRGRLDDQVDAAAGAFNHLKLDTTYNHDFSKWL